MKTLLILFILCSLVMQCTPDREAPYKFKVVEKIKFKEMPYPDILGETIQLVKWNDLLFINDYFGDSLIHVFGLNEGIIKRKLISKGEGPNEAISPLDIQIVDNRLYILSRPLFSLQHLDLSSIDSNNITIEKDAQTPALSDCFIPLGNSRFVFSGFFAKRYAYWDLKKENELKEFGDYPDYWSDEKSFPSDVRAFFHQCIFTKHPTKNLFASCSAYVLEIFTYDPYGNDLPQLKFKKQLGKYSYDYVKEELVSARARRGSDPGIKEFTSTDKYIYMVIPSRSDKTKRNIMVIDWDGQPVKLLTSDKKINSFLIDEQSGKGYCIIEDPEETLAYFNLPGDN